MRLVAGHVGLGFCGVSLRIIRNVLGVCGALLGVRSNTATSCLVSAMSLLMIVQAWYCPSAVRGVPVTSGHATNWTMGNYLLSFFFLLFSGALIRFFRSVLVMGRVVAYESVSW